MGIEAVALAVMAAATGYSAYQGAESAGDARASARKQENKALQLRDEETRNRLQAVMRMQKRAGSRGFTASSSPTALGAPIEGQKTLLGL